MTHSAFLACAALWLVACGTTVQDLGGSGGHASGNPNALEPGDGRQLASGGNTTCFRRADGAVKCWGQNDRGQVSVATTQKCGLLDCTSQPFTSEALRDAARVVLGGRFGCALMADASSRCWGENSFGELGRGTSDADAHLEPQRVPLNRAVGIWLGSHHGCAITNAGVTLCWGLGDDGQLGLDPSGLGRCAVPDELAGAAGVPNAADAACALEPVVVPSFEGAVQLALGDAHTCARFDDGRVVCVGRGSSGQLGAGQPSASAFAAVEALGEGASDLATGSRHTCAVTAGRVRCWGDNAAGQLGVGSAPLEKCGDACLTVPTPLADLPDASSLALGARFSCAKLKDGHVRCWGDDSSGQLGNSSFPNEACKPSIGAAFPCLKSPAAAAYGLDEVLELQAGADHACALVKGELRCWGSSDSGQGWGNSSVAFPSAIYGLN